MIIRKVKSDDAKRLSEIYSYYVTNTAVTFECTAPDENEFKRRIGDTLLKYPYFVAEDEGLVVGYAYAGPFKKRSAYDRSVEVSIYVEKNCRGNGIGKMLYTALEDELRSMGITNAYACIAYPEQEDWYLTFASSEFHEHMGYCIAGRFHKCAYKFNTWYGMVCMEKFLSPHTVIPD